MASQQRPGDPKPLIMDSQQLPAYSKTIYTSLEECANGFTAASWRIQTINHGFTTIQRDGQLALNMVVSVVVNVVVNTLDNSLGNTLHNSLHNVVFNAVFNVECY